MVEVGRLQVGRVGTGTDVRLKMVPDVRIVVCGGDVCMALVSVRDTYAAEKQVVVEIDLGEAVVYLQFVADSLVVLAAGFPLLGLVLTADEHQRHFFGFDASLVIVSDGKLVARDHAYGVYVAFY